MTGEYTVNLVINGYHARQLCDKEIVLVQPHIERERQVFSYSSMARIYRRLDLYAFGSGAGTDSLRDLAQLERTLQESCAG